MAVISPVESLVEFIQRETVFLGAVALDGKGGTYAAHSGAFFNIQTPDQAADQASSIRIACACRVLNLPGPDGGNADFTIQRGKGIFFPSR